MSEDATINAYMRRYDKIYDPPANAVAIEEKNAARRVRLAQLYAKPRRDA